MVNGNIEEESLFPSKTKTLFSLFVRWAHRLCSLDDLYVWIYETCSEVTRMVLLGEERLCRHLLQRFLSLLPPPRLFFFSFSFDHRHSSVHVRLDLLSSHGWLVVTLTLNERTNNLSCCSSFREIKVE